VPPRDGDGTTLDPLTQDPSELLTKIPHPRGTGRERCSVPSRRPCDLQIQ
jgi:hypothetical protein